MAMAGWELLISNSWQQTKGRSLTSKLPETPCPHASFTLNGFDL